PSSPTIDQALQGFRVGSLTGGPSRAMRPGLCASPAVSSSRPATQLGSTDRPVRVCAHGFSAPELSEVPSASSRNLDVTFSPDIRAPSPKSGSCCLYAHSLSTCLMTDECASTATTSTSRYGYRSPFLPCAFRCIPFLIPSSLPRSIHALSSSLTCMMVATTGLLSR